MPQSDLPIAELRAYTPALDVPADLDAFWASTLAEARTHDLDVSCTPVETGLTVVDTFDVAYAGFGGSTVRAWLHLPAGRTGPLPVVVEYLGYGGGRGLPHERILYAAAGSAHLIMDTRGQGSAWSVGDTPDPGATRSAVPPGVHDPGHPGSGDLLLPARLHRCRPRRRSRADDGGDRPVTDRRDGWQPGWRDQPGGRGAGARPGRR